MSKDRRKLRRRRHFDRQAFENRTMTERDRMLMKCRIEKVFPDKQSRQKYIVDLIRGLENDRIVEN